MYIRSTYYHHPVTRDYFRSWTSNIIDTCLEQNQVASMFTVEIDTSFNQITVCPGLFGLLGSGAVNGVTGEKHRLVCFRFFRRRWLKRRDLLLRRFETAMSKYLDAQHGNR